MRICQHLTQEGFPECNLASSARGKVVENCTCVGARVARQYMLSVLDPQETDPQVRLGAPIWESTLSSHCRGPFSFTSIQQGVEVTSCREYSAPQPFTKEIRKVHMRASWYTASNPC